MFENLKLNNLKKKSAEEIEILRQLEADRDALKPASYALQPACEAAALQRQAWTLSHGPGSPPDRLKELDDETKRLEAARDIPIKKANDAIGKQAEIVRAISRPYLFAFSQWGRAAMQAAPQNDEFVGYIQKAIGEIDGMSLQPLEKVLAAIERHTDKIEGWNFEEKPKTSLPAFRLQDVLLSA